MVLGHGKTSAVLVKLPFFKVLLHKRTAPPLVNVPLLVVEGLVQDNLAEVFGDDMKETLLCADLLLFDN